MDAMEEMGGPPQRTETPPPAAGRPNTEKASGGVDKPAIQHADRPGHGGKQKRRGIDRLPTWHGT